MTKKYIPGFGYVPDPDNPYYAKVAEIEKTKKRFLEAYPHADLKQFSFGPTFVTFNHKGTGIDVFIGKVGRGEKVHHYTDSYIEKPLEAALDKPWSPPPRFPLEYTFQTTKLYPIPSNHWDATSPNPSPLLLNQDIQVSPTASFLWKPRNIFQNTSIIHTTAKESHEWLTGPNMRYWPQQLTFALWVATAGCGIGFDMFSEQKTKIGSSPIHMIWSVIRFHVYLTTRLVLQTLQVPLPGDAAFNAKNNPYNKSAYEALCREYSLIPKTSDFRYTGGANHGLGEIYKKVFGKTLFVPDSFNQKGASIWPGGVFFFADESDSWGDHVLDHIKQLEKHPYRFWIPNSTFDTFGFTKVVVLRAPVT